MNKLSKASTSVIINRHNEYPISIWDILFNNETLSIWSCFYCIDKEDVDEVRNAIRYPKHAFFYSVETENYTNKLDIIKDNILTLFLYYKFMYADEEIKDIINKNKEKMDYKFSDNLLELMIDIYGDEIRFHIIC